MTAPTDADIAHVRAAFAAFNERFETLQQDEDALRAYFLEWYAEDAVFTNAEHFPVPARHQGVSGYVEWFSENYAPYEAVRWALDDVTAVGDRLVVEAAISGLPTGAPQRLEIRVNMVYAMRDGRIAEADVFLDHDRALAFARG